MKIKLKQAFDLQMGKTPARTQAEYWGGDHRWVSIADIGNTEKFIAKTKECITDAGVSGSGIKVVPQGTVIMSFKLSIGKTAITAQDMYTNEAIMAFIDKGVFAIDPNYLYHLCCGTNWTAGTNKAVMGLTLNKATLLEKEIPLPDICEQREIAAKLDKIDEIIADRQLQMELIDQTVKSRFIELFGDPEQNPMAWTKQPLSEIIINANNGMARRGNDPHGSIVMRLVELQDGHIDYSTPNRIVLTDTEKGRYLLRENDFLFARVNGNPEYVGRCAVFHEIGEPVYHNDHIIRVHFDDTVLNGAFASALINSAYGKRQMRGQIKTSAGQYTISQDGIGAITAILPPMALQQQFAAFVEQTDKSKYYSSLSYHLCRQAASYYRQEWMTCRTSNS